MTWVITLFHTSFRGVFTAKLEDDFDIDEAVPYLISRCFHSSHGEIIEKKKAVPYLISRCFHSRESKIFLSK